MIYTLASLIVSHAEYLSKNLSEIFEMVNIENKFFVKKIQFLCSSDHPNLFEFCQLVVKIVNKELQIVF